MILKGSLPVQVRTLQTPKEQAEGFQFYSTIPKDLCLHFPGCGGGAFHMQNVGAPLLMVATKNGVVVGKEIREPETLGKKVSGGGEDIYELHPCHYPAFEVGQPLPIKKQELTNRKADVKSPENLNIPWKEKDDPTPQELEREKLSARIEEISKFLEEGQKKNPDFIPGRQDLSIAWAEANVPGWSEKRDEMLRLMEQIKMIRKGRVSKVPKNKTICVDFDGVIAKYDGWKGEDHMGDPIKGCKEAMDALKKAGNRLIIFTTRGNKAKLIEYLKENEIPYDYINHNPDQPEGASDKPIADIYLDDHAVRFEDWGDAVKEMRKASFGSSHYWLNPDGEVLPSPGGHGRLFPRIFGDDWASGKLSALLLEDSLYKEAFKKGWVRVAYLYGDGPGETFWTYSKNATASQIRALKDFAIENGMVTKACSTREGQAEVSSAWMSPEGRVCPVKNTHWETAEQLIGASKDEYAEGLLYKRGWIRVVKEGYSYLYVNGNANTSQTITRAQKQALEDLAVKHNLLINFTLLNDGEDHYNGTLFDYRDKRGAQSKLPGSVDAHAWAREWLKTVEKNPDIPSDEDCMATWFANAIMAGYDEAKRRGGKINCGWLKPDGTLVPAMAGSHWDVANKHFGPKDPMALAFKAGWVRVTHGADTLYVYLARDSELTPKQRQALIDLAIENDYNSVVRDFSAGLSSGIGSQGRVIWTPED